MIWFLIYLGAMVLFIVTMLLIKDHLPIGYEDEQGFHYGDKHE